MMRPFLDPATLVACVLLCGGWVCQSNADNRCPGALTCDVDVANVCCPFGAPVWCDGCTDSSASCSGEVRKCTDLARVLECSFSATITSAQCVGSATGSGGLVTWTIEVSGSMTGCGEEVAFVAMGDDHVDPSCGSWSEGSYGGCIPPEDAISTTSWSISKSIDRPRTDTTPVEVSVLRGHGANPVLAHTEVVCTP